MKGKFLKCLRQTRRRIWSLDAPTQLQSSPSEEHGRVPVGYAQLCRASLSPTKLIQVGVRREAQGHRGRGISTAVTEPKPWKWKIAWRPSVGTLEVEGSFQPLPIHMSTKLGNHLLISIHARMQPGWMRKEALVSLHFVPYRFCGSASVKA